jgi:hypothetical protein
MGARSSATLRTRSGGPRWSSRKPSSVPGTRVPGMVICLGWPSPATSSSLPAACPVGVGHTSPLIWPCSDWGLPCHRRCRRRGGLLPHRFTLTQRLPGGRSVFCGPVRRLSAPRRYLAVYPVELGLSSKHLAAPATITLDQRGEYNRGRRERRKDGKTERGKDGKTERGKDGGREWGGSVAGGTGVVSLPSSYPLSVLPSFRLSVLTPSPPAARAPAGPGG